MQVCINMIMRKCNTASNLFCCLGGIPRLLLFQHSLYVGVVEKTLPAPLTVEQYRKMEPKYTEGGHFQSDLRP